MKSTVTKNPKYIKRLSFLVFGIGSIRGIDAKENGIKIDHNMSSRKFIWVSGNDSIALVDKDCQKAMKFRNFWYSEPEDAQTFRPLAVCYSESIQTFFGLIKRLSGDYCLRLLEVIDIFIDKRYAKDVQVMEGSCSKTREVRLRDFDKQSKKYHPSCISPLIIDSSYQIQIHFLPLYS